MSVVEIPRPRQTLRRRSVRPDLVRLDDISPGHSGYLTASPVTNAQLLSFLNSAYRRAPAKDFRLLINLTNPNLPIRSRDRSGFTCPEAYLRHPAVGVTWLGAARFARALGGRLPTAAEIWLCCVDETTRYPWGHEEPRPEHANFGHHYGGTTPVGEVGPCLHGLTDVVGNVYEWTSQRAGDGVSRVTAGAGWASRACELRIGHTGQRLPLMGGASCGFRVWLPHSRVAEGSTMLWHADRRHR